MTNAAKKFIVWDWNGTLQDDFTVSLAATNMNLQNLGKPEIEAGTYRECFDVPIDRLYRNLGLSEEEITHCLTSMQDNYFETYDKMVAHVDFRPGAREILDFTSAQSITHVILSNHLVEAIAKDLHRLQKRDAFHDILAWPNRETQFAHPKGDLLAVFMKRHDFRSENGMIVGDTPEEVKIARAFGLVSVALSDGYNSLPVL